MVETDKNLVQTRFQTKSSGGKVPEVHGIDKSLNPHVKPERQNSVVTPPTNKTLPIDKGLPMDNKPPIPKPRIGQGRAGIRRKARVILPIQTPAPPIPTPSPRAVSTTTSFTSAIAH